MNRNEKKTVGTLIGLPTGALIGVVVGLIVGIGVGGAIGAASGTHAEQPAKPGDFNLWGLLGAVDACTSFVGMIVGAIIGALTGMLGGGFIGALFGAGTGRVIAKVTSGPDKSLGPTVETPAALDQEPLTDPADDRVQAKPPAPQMKWRVVGVQEGTGLEIVLPDVFQSSADAESQARKMARENQHLAVFVVGPDWSRNRVSP